MTPLNKSPNDGFQICCAHCPHYAITASRGFFCALKTNEAAAAAGLTRDVAVVRRGGEKRVVNSKPDHDALSYVRTDGRPLLLLLILLHACDSGHLVGRGRKSADSSSRQKPELASLYQYTVRPPNCTRGGEASGPRSNLTYLYIVAELDVFHHLSRPTAETWSSQYVERAAVLCAVSRPTAGTALGHLSRNSPTRREREETAPRQMRRRRTHTERPKTRARERGGGKAAIAAAVSPSLRMRRVGRLWQQPPDVMRALQVCPRRRRRRRQARMCTCVRTNVYFWCVYQSV